MLCREQKIGLSAKSPFAESSPQQTIPLGKYVFAESNTLGKEKRSAKHNFPRALLSAKTDLRQKSPRTVQTGGALDVILFAESHQFGPQQSHHFAERLCEALGEEAFCRVPSGGTRQNLLKIFPSQFETFLLLFLHYPKQDFNVWTIIVTVCNI
jgi:hypothetical protein